MGSIDKERAKNSQLFSQLAYEQNPNMVKVKLGLSKSGYRLDDNRSGAETKTFYNPTTKDAVMAFRGTDLSDKKRRMKDVYSDLHIAAGTQRKDKRFKQSNKRFRAMAADDKYKDYKLNVTGHSLGGSLTDFVAKKNEDLVNTAYAFSRGAGPAEAHRLKAKATVDFSNRYDPVSHYARVQNMNLAQNKQQAMQHVNKGFHLNPLKAHNIVHAL
mmetsp:Transcript_10329/g.13425  ORF Transcript_10329/g.13425 Transcript_10329/m.13425 type:complete len:214 (+) Transcript_10329:301-942(+)